MIFPKRLMDRVKRDFGVDARFDVEGSPMRLGTSRSTGLRLLLDESSLVDREILVNGEWEPDQQAHLFETAEALIGRAAERPAVFLDVGAYWGLYAIRACRSGLFDRVIAFEPEPRNRAQLHAQLVLNGLAYAVEVSPLAASDVAEQTAFLRGDRIPTGNRAGAAIRSEGADTVAVETARLDDVLDLADRTIVMKLDVEGNEARAIRGAARTLTSNRCFLQIEAFAPSAPGVDVEMVALGYRKTHQIHVDHFYCNAPEIGSGTAAGVG